MGSLLEVNNLRKHFPVTKGIFLRGKTRYIRAVDGVSFHIERGETLGLVGESGSGKTTVGRCILQTIRPTAGDIMFDGRSLTDLDGEQLRTLRRHMQLIAQDPYGSLDPSFTVGEIVGEPAVVHHAGSKVEIRDKVKEILALVGLPLHATKYYPHMFSGGQRQRIAIARAIILQPSFIVCDEPVSALDVSIQAQIINLLMEIQEKLQLSYLFIAHDLSVVRHISHRVAVMYAGKVVEITSAASLFKSPLHFYTRALVSAVPIPDPVIEASRQRIVISGEVPSLLDLPPGCRFYPRCWAKLKRCAEEEPVLRNVGESHWVACHDVG